jgi:hypothetical protein
MIVVDAPAAAASPEATPPATVTVSASPSLSSLPGLSGLSMSGRVGGHGNMELHSRNPSTASSYHGEPFAITVEPPPIEHQLEVAAAHAAVANASADAETF